MPLLTIEKDELRPSELTAKLDGVPLPLMTSIKIISIVGDITKVEITFAAGVMNDGGGVLIKESALRA